MGNADGEMDDLSALRAECKRLRVENARLRSLWTVAFPCWNACLRSGLRGTAKGYAVASGALTTLGSQPRSATRRRVARRA